MNKKYILAIDPGKEKCGLALVDYCGQVELLKALSLADFRVAFDSFYQKYEIDYILLGNGTGSKNFVSKLTVFNDEKLTNKIKIVDEKHTTLLARKIYWQMNPPKGWRRLLPQGLLVVPEVIDAYAALAIARKWLEEKIG